LSERRARKAGTNKLQRKSNCEKKLGLFKFDFSVWIPVKCAPSWDKGSEGVEGGTGVCIVVEIGIGFSEAKEIFIMHENMIGLC
jgi:hypothetical protein